MTEARYARRMTTSRDHDKALPAYPMITALRFKETFLRNAEIYFSPGLNVIFGLNGTGKTMTVESIRCTVLGHPTRRRRPPIARRGESRRG